MTPNRVSADYAMKKGIARKIKDRFGRTPEWKSQRAGVGQISIWKNEGRYIFHLVTKSRYYEKPTMQALQAALMQLKQFMIQNRLTLLAVPKLSCGLDRMLWAEVEPQLKRIFDNSGILIIVHTL